jgi:signal peptidase I
LEKNANDDIIEENNNDPISDLDENAEDVGEFDSPQLELTIENLEDHQKIDSRIFRKVFTILFFGIVYLMVRIFSRNSDDTYQFIDFIVIVTSMISLLGLSIFAHSKIINPTVNGIRIYPNKTNKLKGKKYLFEVLDLVSIVPICAVIVTFIFAWIFVFPVEGPSMNPNIQDGETMFALVKSNPSRFDVVVIQIDPKYYDHNTRERFLKRVIGVPGDTLAHDGFHLFINGEMVQEPFLLDDLGQLKRDIFGNLYITPSFNFVPNNNNRVCRIKTESTISMCPVEEGVMVIPAGYYFVLGDNRSDSTDSPDIGLVCQEDDIGIVKYHIYSIFDWKKVY